VARPPRIQVAGGTYYLLQLANRWRPLFASPSDYDMLEQLLARAVARRPTRVLAFCWLPYAIHLVAHNEGALVSRFMQGLASSYARYVNRQTQASGPLFSSRFHSALVESEVWLPELVRFVHYVPVLAGLAATPAAYFYSSYRQYLGDRRVRWLDWGILRDLLDQRGLTASQQMHFLASPPNADEISLFSQVSDTTALKIGSATFHAQHRGHPQHRHPPLTLASLTDRVAHVQGIPRAKLFSRSRERSVALARSLIAWHAMERRLATLAQLARYFSRDASTLSKAIVRHRRQQPSLFRLDAWSHLVPLR
jgi:putative transposase